MAQKAGESAQAAAVQTAGPATPAQAAAASRPQRGPVDEDDARRVEFDRQMTEAAAKSPNSAAMLAQRIIDSGYGWVERLHGVSQMWQVAHRDDVFGDRKDQSRIRFEPLSARQPTRGTRINVRGGETIFHLQRDHASWTDVRIPTEGEGKDEPLIPEKLSKEGQAALDALTAAPEDPGMTKALRDANDPSKRKTKARPKAAAKKAGAKRAASKSASKGSPAEGGAPAGEARTVDEAAEANH